MRAAANRVAALLASSLAVVVAGAIAVEMLASGAFSSDDPQRFQPIVQSLEDFDRYMVAADFDAYWEAQRAIDRLWRQPDEWWRKSILNTAGMAWFSSDRTIREYTRDIWRVPVG